MNKIEKLKEIINKSDNIVVITGAGVSTDSGIKDFRSKDGLSKESSIPMEILLSSNYFYSYTEDFYEFYRKYFDCSNIEPNVTHKYLKKLEDEGKLKAIITQNIDGLHSKAGNKNVFELHGTTFSNHCIKCNKKYDSKKVFNSNGIPKCSCGGIIKPDVVLYGESLPIHELNTSIEKIKEADLLLVLGTSLVVYPAAGLIEYFNGKNLVIINRDKTSYDSVATLVMHDNLSDVFNYLNECNKIKEKK
jgi:NAD-dependent deacetylase